LAKHHGGGPPLYHSTSMCVCVYGGGCLAGQPVICSTMLSRQTLHKVQTADSVQPGAEQSAAVVMGGSGVSVCVHGPGSC
jgi:hypothetical protein